VESKQRFPHPHSPDYDGGEIYSATNLMTQTPKAVTGRTRDKLAVEALWRDNQEDQHAEEAALGRTDHRSAEAV
jgi:hypothetical protein